MFVMLCDVGEKQAKTNGFHLALGVMRVLRTYPKAKK